MAIGKKLVARQLSAYLRREMTLAELVDWAESAMMEGDFEEADATVIREVVGRLGVADVRAFGLVWEDCEGMLRELGFAVRLDVVPV